MSKVRGPRGFEKAISTTLHLSVSISEEVTLLPIKLSLCLVVIHHSGTLAPLSQLPCFPPWLIAVVRIWVLFLLAFSPSQSSPVSPAFPSLCFPSHSVVPLPQSHWLSPSPGSTAGMSCIGRFPTPKLVPLSRIQPSA